MSSTRSVGLGLVFGLSWAVLCTPLLQAAPAAQAARLGDRLPLRQ